MRIPNPVHLETLGCIARMGTFSGAAALLNTTQSAVSARVREVEEMVGKPLFRRTGRRVEMTDEGRRFVVQMEPILRQLKDVMSAFHHQNMEGGRLRIGVGSSCFGCAGAILQAIQQEFPRLSFDLFGLSTMDMLRDVEKDRLDLAIISLRPHEVRASSIRAVGLGSDTLRWVISPHRLNEAGGAAASPQEILNRNPLWCAPRTMSHFEMTMRILREAGVSVIRINFATSMPGMVEIIKSGYGFGLVTGISAQPALDEGTLVTALEAVLPSLPIDLYMIHSPHQTSTRILKILEIAQAASVFRPSRP